MDTTSTRSAGQRAVRVGTDKDRLTPWRALVDRRFFVHRRFYVFRILMSKRWRFIKLICILFNLFGVQLKIIFFNSVKDNPLILILLFCLCVFVADIVFRIFVYPEYFDFGCFGHSLRSCQTKNNQKNHWNNDLGSWCNWIRLGSFPFWCDLVATCSIVIEIVIMERDGQSITYELDDLGIASVVGRNEYNTPTGQILLVVFKTVRVVRSVRFSTAAKFVAGSALFKFVINPGVKLEDLLIRKVRKPRDGTEGDKEKNGKTTGESDGSAAVYISERRASFGGLGSAVLAFVRAQKRAKEALERENRGPFGNIKRALRDVGVVRDDRIEWMCQLAASKIQHAWSQHAWRAASKVIEADNLSFRDIKTSLRTAGKANSARASNRSLKHSGVSMSGVFEAVNHRPKTKKKPSESQVGSVALGIILALIITTCFTFEENDTSRKDTMAILHYQTVNKNYANRSVYAALETTLPNLFEYRFQNGTVLSLKTEKPGLDNEILVIKVYNEGSEANFTEGKFDNRDLIVKEASEQLLAAIFIIISWLLGMSAFVGPVMILGVMPMEKMP